MKSCGQGIILSTDDFFSKNGIYHFKADRLSEAHSWNQKRALTAVENKVKLLIIDNTNTMSWEMRPYIEMGVVNKLSRKFLSLDVGTMEYYKLCVYKTMPRLNIYTCFKKKEIQKNDSSVSLLEFK